MNFRSVSVDVDQPLSTAEEAVLASLRELVSSEGGLIALDGTSLSAHLVALDARTAEALLATQLAADSPVRKLIKRILSIRSFGIRNGRRIYVGYDEERKVAGRKKKELDRHKFFYASDAVFSREDNPLPPEFRDSIIAGDSETVLRRLPNNCIDIVFTSPPYNFGLDYAGDSDAAHWRAYFDKLMRILDECVRVLKFGGRLLVNVQPLFSDYIPTHHIVSAEMMRRGLIWKGELLWEKNNYNCKYTAWGSYKSPSSPYLKYTWEFVEVFCKGDLKKAGSAVNADIADDEFKKWVVAKWSIAPERRMKELGHPAVFPEELAERALKLFSFRGDIVLDPFNGVGTTTLVAHNTGRSFVGIDVSEQYCETARQRIRGAAPQERLFTA